MYPLFFNGAVLKQESVFLRSQIVVDIKYTERFGIPDHSGTSKHVLTIEKRFSVFKANC